MYLQRLDGHKMRLTIKRHYGQTAGAQCLSSLHLLQDNGGPIEWFFTRDQSTLEWMRKKMKGFSTEHVYKDLKLKKKTENAGITHQVRLYL